MMRYSKSYREWLENQNQASLKIIKEFKLTFLLSLLKKDREGDKSLGQSDIMLSGNMSDLNFYLTPHIYNSLLNITELLTGDENDDDFEHQVINEKVQAIKMASKIGVLKVSRKNSVEGDEWT